jgi:hypothetical protein
LSVAAVRVCLNQLVPVLNTHTMAIRTVAEVRGKAKPRLLRTSITYLSMYTSLLCTRVYSLRTDFARAKYTYYSHMHIYRLVQLYVGYIPSLLQGLRTTYVLTLRGVNILYVLYSLMHNNIPVGPTVCRLL